MNRKIMKIRRRVAQAIWSHPPYPYQNFNDKYQVVFIHIPKCGGTSLLRQFDPKMKRRTHVEAIHYRDASPERFRDYVTFTFVRNPVSRLISTYQYFSEGGNGSEIASNFRAACLDGRSFNEFVMEELTEDLCYNWNMLRPQWCFINFPFETVRIDQIYRVEDYDSAIDSLNRLIPELNLKNIKLNSSKGSTNIDGIDSRVIEKIRFIYARDFEELYPEAG